MSPDARSLFRAAASERRGAAASGLSDPFASYNPSTGALRCSACHYLTIKHENLWAPHAASKSHRTNVAKIKAEREQAASQQLEEQQQRQAKESKRKASPDGADGPSETDGVEGGTKRTRVEDVAANGAKVEIDPEWELFQKEMARAEEEARRASEPNPSTYANATIEVEPVIRGQQTAAVEGETESEATTANGAAQPNVKETEEEKRARRDQEEREEIYSRYEEEQRIQDEAEERVSALKQKLEKIKAARLARKQQAKK